MKTPLQLLNDIQIASPCPASWDAMTGDRFVRHCDQCNKSVFALSELTTQQAVDLIREKEGELCVRLYRRQDGTVLTADCPIGVRERTRRFMRRGLALAASFLTFGMFAGCNSKFDCFSTQGSMMTGKAPPKTPSGK